jgi:hypothetical protein
MKIATAVWALICLVVGCAATVFVDTVHSNVERAGIDRSVAIVAVSIGTR